MQNTILDFLYNDKNTDILIENVGFHLLVLSTIDYFKHIISGKYADNINFIDFEEIGFKNNKSIILFKKWLYSQPITQEELDTETIIYVHNISDYLDINMYRDLQSPIILFTLNTTSENQFQLFKTIDIYDRRFNLTNSQIKSLPQDSFPYAVCVFFDLVSDEKRSPEELFNNIFQLSQGIDPITGLTQDRKENVPNIKAYHMLGLSLQQSKDEGKKFQAFNIFKRGWKKYKDDKCLYDLANCYKNGIGCEQDIKEALELHNINWNENKNFQSYREIQVILYKDAFILDAINILYHIWLDFKDVYSVYEMMEMLKNNRSKEIFQEDLHMGMKAEINKIK